VTMVSVLPVRTDRYKGNAKERRGLAKHVGLGVVTRVRRLPLLLMRQFVLRRGARSLVDI
jgi:hypothetical protein